MCNLCLDPDLNKPTNCWKKNNKKDDQENLDIENLPDNNKKLSTQGL